ncbi:ATP-dependent sacrificial sulfur transferase LarE [Symmachiella dynata]|uniref:ATP-dependent sacrificial sulfur transferase LarE n=1 Tax=Symmachiella dynata TaxID=2527995 RepID=UPI0030EC15BB
MSDSLPVQLVEKRDALLGILSGYGRVAVAFSAGIDSTVVAKAAQLACGDRAVTVTADSPSLASGELEEAKRLAALIGIRHQIVRTEEFENSDYLKNASNRCYFCKTELYTQLEGLAPQLNVDVIVNGANLDDRGDHRPGMQAASEHDIRSPLIEAEFTKADVRALAADWELPIWDKPASPCLSSRIAYGLSVTPERVRRVDKAERFLREELGLRELRVRHEPNDLARIEVPVTALARFANDDIRDKITTHFKSLGFKFITLDLEGFRSGSMNSVLPLESLTMSAK